MLPPDLTNHKSASWALGRRPSDEAHQVKVLREDGVDEGLKLDPCPFRCTCQACRFLYCRSGLPSCRRPSSLLLSLPFGLQSKLRSMGPQPFHHHEGSSIDFRAFCYLLGLLGMRTQVAVLVGRTPAPGSPAAGAEAPLPRSRMTQPKPRTFSS